MPNREVVMADNIPGEKVRERRKEKGLTLHQLGGGSPEPIIHI